MRGGGKGFERSVMGWEVNKGYWVGGWVCYDLNDKAYWMPNGPVEDARGVQFGYHSPCPVSCLVK